MNRGFKRTTALILTLVLAFSLSAGALSADKAAVDKTRNDVAAIMLNTVKNPVVDSIGGEWAVLSLARSGYDVPRSVILTRLSGRV